MRLFLAPVGHGNIQISIAQGISFDRLRPLVGETGLAKLRAVYGTSECVYCWGMPLGSRRTFECMTTGDTILFQELLNADFAHPGSRGAFDEEITDCEITDFALPFQEHEYIIPSQEQRSGYFTHRGTVILKAESASFASKMWRQASSNHLIYFINGVVKTRISQRSLYRLLGYKVEGLLLGTRRVEKGRLEAFAKNTGSVVESLNLIDELKGYVEEQVTSKSGRRPAPTSSDWLLPLLQNIDILQRDGRHQERAHEDLVRQFLELLGLRIHDEIIFRQGYIDVCIRQNGKIILVVEVKRDWNLSRRSVQALRQAYGYAQEKGVAHVAITNGVYYAFFNRNKGLDYESNFECEFHLTDFPRPEPSIVTRIRNRDFL